MSAIDKLMQALKALQSLHPRMELSSALVLLEVSKSSGLRQVELAKRLGISQTAVSRNMAILGRFNDVGLGLVEFQDDPNDRRVHVLKFTSKGRALIRRLETIIEATSEG